MTSLRVLLDRQEPEKSRCIVDYNQEEYIPNSIKCLCYCRCSTEKQIPTSIPEQEYEIIQFCKNNNLYIKAWYYDLGISGAKNVDVRLGLGKLIEDILPGEKFIVCDQSRIFRDIHEITGIVSKFIKKKIKICILNFNNAKDITEEDESEFIFNIMASVYQQERKTIRKRVKNAMNILKQTGNLKPKPRYGEKFVGKNMDYVVDENEVKIIKYIGQLRKDNPNISIAEICRILTKEFPCDKSECGFSKWWPTKIKKIIEQNKI